MLGKGILGSRSLKSLKPETGFFPATVMAPEVLRNGALGYESGQLASVILWSAEGRARNAGREHWSRYKWQWERKMERPGGNLAHREAYQEAIFL